MSKSGKTLAQMVQSPKKGWTINELAAVARHYKIDSEFNGAGSHVQFHVDSPEKKVIGVATMSGRTILPVYVENFCAFVFSVSPQAIEDCKHSLKNDRAGMILLEKAIAKTQVAGIG